MTLTNPICPDILSPHFLSRPCDWEPGSMLISSLFRVLTQSQPAWYQHWKNWSFEVSPGCPSFYFPNPVVNSRYLRLEHHRILVEAYEKGFLIVSSVYTSSYTMFRFRAVCIYHFESILSEGPFSQSLSGIITWYFLSMLNFSSTIPNTRNCPNSNYFDISWHKMKNNIVCNIA